MKLNRVFCSALLFVSISTAQSQPARAGLMMLPFLPISIPVMYYGVKWGLVAVFLLSSEGGRTHDQLVATLAERFPQIEDRQVLENLALAIRQEEAKTPADSAGNKLIRLERAQVLELLAPTGLVELEPAIVGQIIHDLG